jgi:hypothetical protein
VQGLSDKWVATEKFVNVLASWLLLENAARVERSYKRVKEFCILLAQLSPFLARVRMQALAMLTPAEYDAAVTRAYSYAGRDNSR